MKKVTAVVAVLLALTLTGCAGEAEDAAYDRTAPAVSESAAPDVTPAPLVAETEGGSDEAAAESGYLVSVRERLSGIQSQIPNATDEQLLAAGHEACDRLESGESGESMSLIDGEELTNGYYMDSGAIIIAARTTMCPAK